MKKLIPLFIGFAVSILAIIPPLGFSVNFTNSPIRFVWTFLFCGILAFYFIFTRANIFLKILIPYLFLNSFLSSIPHVSMAAFIWIVIGAYFYLLCLHVKDWRPVFKIVGCILMLQLMLAGLKILNKETLLNFGKTATMCFGSVGNGMQFKSLIIVLIAFAMQGLNIQKKYIKAFILVSLISILGLFLTRSNIYYFTYARGAVWLETIRLSLRHPFIGYGLGTYEAIFHVLAKGGFIIEGVWTNAHNDFLQFLFDAGFIGFIVLVAYIGQLLIKCRGILLLGFAMIMLTLCIHFPMQQNSTQLLIIAFFAYCEQRVKERESWPQLKSE